MSAAYRLTDGPPIPATHVPRPVVYRAERVQVGRRLWWPGVPQACAECRGRLVEDDDRIVCVLCSREPFEVRERRPAPLPAFEEARRGPKRAVDVEKPDGACSEAGCVEQRAPSRQWCSKHRTARYRERLLETGLACVVDGCDEPRHVFGPTVRFCRQHNAEYRRTAAKKAKVAS